MTILSFPRTDTAKNLALDLIGKGIDFKVLSHDPVKHRHAAVCSVSFSSDHEKQVLNLLWTKNITLFTIDRI